MEKVVEKDRGGRETTERERGKHLGEISYERRKCIEEGKAGGRMRDLVYRNKGKKEKIKH